MRFQKTTERIINITNNTLTGHTTITIVIFIEKFRLKRISYNFPPLCIIDGNPAHNFRYFSSNLRQIGGELFLIKTELKYLIFHTHVVVCNPSSLKTKTILIRLQIQLFERVVILQSFILKPTTILGKTIINILTKRPRSGQTSVSLHQLARGSLRFSTFGKKLRFLIQFICLSINQSILHNIRHNLRRFAVINLRGLTGSRTGSTSGNIRNTSGTVHQIRIQIRGLKTSTLHDRSIIGIIHIIHLQSKRILLIHQLGLILILLTSGRTACNSITNSRNTTSDNIRPIKSHNSTTHYGSHSGDSNWPSPKPRFSHPA